MTHQLTHIFHTLVRDWPTLQHGSATQRRRIHSYIRGLAQVQGVYDDIFDTLLTLADYYVKEIEYVPDHF